MEEVKEAHVFLLIAGALAILWLFGAKVFKSVRV